MQVRLTPKRLIGAALPAGLITLGLFAAMQHLISVEAVSAPELRVYELPAYMAAEEFVEPERPVREIKLIEHASAPPPPPPLVGQIENVKLPAFSYQGAVPADYGAADLQDLKPKRVAAITARTLQPITPPIPTYPRAAITRGLEGVCEVYLSVSPKGAPFDVSADCTDRVFEQAAIKAVKKVKFAPKIYDGLPVTVIGVVYPLEFRMEP
jgi:protein TonB